MGAQVTTGTSTCDICSKARDHVVCQSEQYLRYECYKMGSKPDMDRLDLIISLIDIVCDGMCYLSEDEVKIAEEKLNMMVV